MASGSSDRSNSGSKGFDFGTDEILCSYEDYGNKDSTNSTHSDPVIASNSTKDYHKSRMSRSSVFHAYAQPEDSFIQDMAVVVERSMKKYTDSLLRFLEGVSSRLSQLELNCYNLDKSIGEMRSDLVLHRADGDSKLKSLEKHLQEVHRSVQILRDKQELADTQKELAKLQLVQKESTSSSHSQSEEKASPPASEPMKPDSMTEMHNPLALALPHQIVPQQKPAPVPPPSQAQPQNVTQQQSYYMSQAQLQNPPVHAPHPQGQYLSSDPQYGSPQMQDMSRVAPQPAQTQINQSTPVPQFAQYQQQWPQQLPQQVQAPQQPPMQHQIRPSSTAVYPTYPPPGQPTNSSPPETMPNSMPMQLSYAAVPQPISSVADAMPYGYGAGRAAPQQPPAPQVKGTYAAPQPGDGYGTSGPHPGLPPASAYMMYDGEGARPHHPPQQPPFPQGGYHPPNLGLQNPQSSVGPNMLPRNPSHSRIGRNHPYSELIDKLVSMGFRADHVVSVIQRIEESGQPLDFNAVIDRLSASGGSQRGWSG